MQNEESGKARFFILHSAFEILHSTVSVNLRATAKGRRMGSGGLRGLQNRCFGAEASKGWFDSDTPPPIWLLARSLRFGRIREKADLHRAPFTRRVHGLHGSLERHLILGIDEHHFVRDGPASHLSADEIGQFLRAVDLLSIE